MNDENKEIVPSGRLKERLGIETMDFILFFIVCFTMYMLVQIVKNKPHDIRHI